ncbi:ThiJ/PfpI family protein [Tricladium varicosporioides]|nr:ThiJ/PfpI family protein [Hymenoscyphus varicosporioides]
MASSTSPRHYNIAVLLYNAADILDFAGPMEVFSHCAPSKDFADPDRLYKITTVGRSNIVPAASSLSVAVNASISDTLEDLEKYDILLIPGGPPDVLAKLVSEESEEMKLVNDFAKLPPRSSSLGPRLIFSICTGAFFPGAAGLFKDINVTTHHMAHEALLEICKGAGGEPKSITADRRYVEGGMCKKEGVNVEILTAGGVSSGLDGAMFLVGRQQGGEMREFVGKIMEYESRVKF